MAEEENENETTDDMSEGEDGEDEQGSGKKKLIIIIAVVVLLLGGGGAAAYFTGMLDDILGVEIDCENIEEGEPHFVECEAKRIAEEGEGANSDGPGEFYEVPNLIVNLNTTGRQPRFLKISIQLEVDSERDVADLEKIAPRVIDHFQTYLRELRIEDLRGSSGIYRLRMELLSRVSAAAPDIHVRDVLFQEILIQ